MRAGVRLFGALRVTDADAAARAELVCAAKCRKFRVTGVSDLTPAELDAILAPVPCGRTRLRIDREDCKRGKRGGS